MIRIGKVAIVAVMLGFSGGIMFSATPALSAGMETVEKRKKLMKEIVGNFKKVKSFAKKGEGSADDAAASAMRMSALAREINALFPKGTGRGDLDAKATRALPAIWNDWATFEASSKALETQSAKLAAVVKTGDKKAIGKQIGMTGKLGCGSCHKPFRGKKVK